MSWSQRRPVMERKLYKVFKYTIKFHYFHYILQNYSNNMQHFLKSLEELLSFLCSWMFIFYRVSVSALSQVCFCSTSVILSSAYLKVYDLQVFYQRDQQAAVVQLLGQLGHSLGVGLLVIASIQDLFHGHQTLRHLLRGL